MNTVLPVRRPRPNQGLREEASVHRGASDAASDIGVRLVPPGRSLFKVFK